MFIYLLTLIYILILVYNYDIRNHTFNYKLNFYIVFIVLVLISGLRYEIGSDTLVYMNEYQYLPDLISLDIKDFSELRYDPLWILFCATCKTITPNFFFLQLIHAIIINALLFRYIKKYALHRFTVILLYYILGFLYFNTEIMRESMAVGVFLLSLNSYQKRKWIKYICIVLFASLFHLSALITLLFPLIRQISLNKFFYVSLVGLGLGAGAIWTFFNEYIQLLFIFSSIESKAASYLQNSVYIYNFSGIIFSLISYVIIPLLCVLYYKKKKEISIEIPFVWLYIALGIFVVFNNTIFFRLQNYLFFPFLIFVTNVFYSFDYSKRIITSKINVLIIVILLLFSRNYNYFKLDVTDTNFIYERYFPYKSIISKESTPARNRLKYR